MAIGTQEDSDQMLSEINMIPFIDVMLVLLIIFIITVPVIKHAVNIDLPRASNEQVVDKPDNIRLSVDASGGYFWNEVPVSDADFDERLAAAAAQQPHPGRQGRALRTRGPGHGRRPAGRGAQDRLHHRTGSAIDSPGQARHDTGEPHERSTGSRPTRDRQRPLAHRFQARHGSPALRGAQQPGRAARPQSGVDLAQRRALPPADHPSGQAHLDQIRQRGTAPTAPIVGRPRGHHPPRASFFDQPAKQRFQ
jgi:biopolymer transport protein ExbD